MLPRRDFITAGFAAVSGSLASWKLLKLPAHAQTEQDEWQTGYDAGREVGEVKAQCMKLIEASNGGGNLIAISMTIDKAYLKDVLTWLRLNSWVSDYVILRHRQIQVDQVALDLKLRPEKRTVK